MSPPIAPAPMTWTWLILVAAAGELLHLLAQEEHPDQVLRRRRHHQIGERGLSRPSASPSCRRRAFPRDRSARKARDNAPAARPSPLRAPHPRGEEAAHRAEVEKRIREGPAAARLRRPNTASLTAFRTWRSCVTASTRPSDLALARVDGLAGQHQGHRLHRIDQMREARGAAEAGMQAEQHLRETEARIVDRDPRLAGRARFQGRRRGRSRGSPQRSESADASSRSITAMRCGHHGLDRAGIGRRRGIR